MPHILLFHKYQILLFKKKKKHTHTAGKISFSRIWRTKIWICLKTVQLLPQHQAKRTKSLFFPGKTQKLNKNASVIVLIFVFKWGLPIYHTNAFFSSRPEGAMPWLAFDLLKFLFLLELYWCFFLCHWKMSTATENWPIQRCLLLRILLGGRQVCVRLLTVCVWCVNIHDAYFNLHFATS